MITDTISSRYISMLALEIYSKLELDHMTSVEFLKEIYQWGDKVISSLGNEGYNVIKGFEAICTGCIISKYDPLSSGENYTREIIMSNESEEERSFLEKLIEILNNMSAQPNHIIEIFGCYRHFGHPVVDENRGVDDLKSNTRLNIPVDESVVR